MARPAARCVGCGTQGRPGRSNSRFTLYERSEDRRRRTRRIGVATAIEWPAVRSALREAVPNEVQAGSAGALARVPGSVRPEVRRDRRCRRCTHAQHGERRVTRQSNGASAEPTAGARNAMPGARRREGPAEQVHDAGRRLPGGRRR